MVAAETEHHTDLLRVNPGVIIFLEEATETLRPYIRLGAFRQQFGMHSMHSLARNAANVEELQQAIAVQHKRLDIRISQEVAVFAVAPSADADAFLKLLRDIDRALSMLPDVRVRLHCFSLLRERREAEAWINCVSAFRQSTAVAGGGAWLLSRRFRGAVLDDVRSYPVLANLLLLFALTGSSRFAPEKCFDSVRVQAPFNVYVAGLQSYLTPPLESIAERLLDDAVWEHLKPEFSSAVVQRLKEARASTSFEEFLIQAARGAVDVEGIASALESWIPSVASPKREMLERMALDTRRALATSTLPFPHPPMGRHAFERVFPVMQNADVRETAHAEALRILDLFPVPLPMYFVDPRHSARILEALKQVRTVALEHIRERLSKGFYEWAEVEERQWMRANISPSGAVQCIQDAVGLQHLGSEAMTFTFLAPALTRDLREELYPDAATITCLELLQLYPQAL